MTIFAIQHVDESSPRSVSRRIYKTFLQEFVRRNGIRFRVSTRYVGKSVFKTLRVLP